MAALLRRALADSLRQFQGMSVNDLRERRFEKLMAYGKYKESLPGA
jgi:acetyl-CoA carboxylase carboxyl transferase subunit alpha